MGDYITIKQRVLTKYPSYDPDITLLELYKQLGTCKKVAEHLGATESGVWRRIHEIELQKMANGNNGFGK